MRDRVTVWDALFARVVYVHLLQFYPLVSRIAFTQLMSNRTSASNVRLYVRNRRGDGMVKQGDNESSLERGLERESISKLVEKHANWWISEALKKAAGDRNVRHY